jgi:hypothetical protein
MGLLAADRRIQLPHLTWGKQALLVVAEPDIVGEACRDAHQHHLHMDAGRLNIQRGQGRGGLLERGGYGRHYQCVRDRLGNDADGQFLLFGESRERLRNVSDRDVL